jgi:3-deoxy-7-phosphoheptulonate synthase
MSIDNNKYKYTARENRPEGSIIDVSGVQIGGEELVVIAGPCSVESKEQILKTAIAVKEHGAVILRGGAFKPRTSPYSFQGLQEEGIDLLAWVRHQIDIPIITEVMDVRKLDLVAETADILQIGSRNMHNTPLLLEVGKIQKPILLKRGMSATIEEFLSAAEYVMDQGNEQIILCERGIRTFEPTTRFTLDIGAIPVLKRMTHLPVFVDPSHGTGHWWMVPELSKAAIAAGADGLIIEVHHDPPQAFCDGQQSLHPETFKKLMEDINNIGRAVGRTIFSSVMT